MTKDFHIWVELAVRKRKCHQCDGDIARGAMFVRMGNREKAARAPCMCATCFDKTMNELSQEFQHMKDMARPTTEPAPAEELALAAPAGPHCFVCGLSPEKCQCAREAYR